MKVKELIEMLEDMDDNLEVFLSYPSGDYWRTTLAAEVGDVEQTTVEMSDYHHSFYVPPDRDKDIKEMDRPRYVVLLSRR